MNFFIIADVHGCLHTLRELLTHWRPAEELLVQLGDLVDRGNYSPETVELCRTLNAEHPGQTLFLQGNHDWGMAAHVGPDGPFAPWLDWGGRLTLQQYRRHPAWLAAHGDWLGQRPLHWENEYVRFSHAGFAYVPDALDPTNPEGVLWRRGPLRNTGQLQVVGHSPTASHQPEFDAIANAIYLDTGAADGHFLTGLRLSETGGVLDTVVIPTYSTDFR